LNLSRDFLVSKFAFKINLYRYVVTTAAESRAARLAARNNEFPGAGAGGASRFQIGGGGGGGGGGVGDYRTLSFIRGEGAVHVECSWPI
jgi:hypothetical protein